MLVCLEVTVFKL